MWLLWLYLLLLTLTYLVVINKCVSEDLGGYCWVCVEVVLWLSWGCDNKSSNWSKTINCLSSGCLSLLTRSGQVKMCRAKSVMCKCKSISKCAYRTYNTVPATSQKSFCLAVSLCARTVFRGAVFHIFIPVCAQWHYYEAGCNWLKCKIGVQVVENLVVKSSQAEIRESSHPQWSLFTPPYILWSDEYSWECVK